MSDNSERSSFFIPPKYGEVLKFGGMLAVMAIAWADVKNEVMQNTEARAEYKVEIAQLKEHNQKQDIETASFRANMVTRVERIEKLTEDIHSVIVGGGR